MLKPRVALGKVWCGRPHRPPCELPAPAPDLPRADGLVVFELRGWDFNEAGELHRVGKRHHSLEYRKDDRARANTRRADAGEKMKIWDPAESLGRRAISMPVVAVCPRCGAPNLLDLALVTGLTSAKQPK